MLRPPKVSTAKRTLSATDCLLHDRRVDEGRRAAGGGHVGDGLLASRVVDIGDDDGGAVSGEGIRRRRVRCPTIHR